MMDSSTFKRFTASIENILENLEDMDFTALGNMSEIFKLLPQIEMQQKPKNLHFSIFGLPSDWFNCLWYMLGYAVFIWLPPRVDFTFPISLAAWDRGSRFLHLAESNRVINHNETNNNLLEFICCGLWPNGAWLFNTSISVS